MELRRWFALVLLSVPVAARAAVVDVDTLGSTGASLPGAQVNCCGSDYNSVAAVVTVGITGN